MSDLALFDLEPETPARPPRVYTPFDAPFIPIDEQLCADCRRKLKGHWAYGCGGSDRRGSFELCDDCAATDVTPAGRPRWGITPEYLAIERTRRRIYAAGGGETEVQAALRQAGLTTTTGDH